MSDSTSSSFSSPVLLNNPQTDILTQIAQAAEAYAQQMEGFASNVYSQTSGITDQTIANYLQSAQMANDAAQNSVSRYEQVFQPLENQLIKDANTYASPSRIQTDMGAAEAGQMQGGDQARINAEKNLEGFGIDPTMGRYQDLERASQLESAASAVGAGQQARRADEQTGRALRSEAIQVGERYPGQAVNFMNTQLAGLAGATNAALGRANTAANLMKLPDAYMNTAMQLRPPPVGQNSQSFSSRGGGGGGGGNKGGGGGGGNNGGNGPAGPRDVGMAYDARNQGNSPYGQSGYGGRGVGGGAGPDIINTYGDNGVQDNTFTDPFNMYSNNGQAWGPDYNQYDPGGQNFDGQWGNFDGNWDNAVNGADPSLWSGYDQQAANYGYGNDGSGGDGSFYGDTSSYYNSGADYGNSAPSDVTSYQDYSGGAGWGDTGGDSGGYTDTSSYDSGGGDYGWGDAGFAAGGAFPPAPTTGGNVPRSASPSGGRQVDDVNAHLNADEFVIPRDVALWKGQEFFQKLIQQSRKAAGSPQQAPAQGKPTNKPLQGPPQFSSKRFDGGGPFDDTDGSSGGTPGDNQNQFQPIPTDDVSTPEQPFGPQGNPTPAPGFWDRARNKAQELIMQDNGYPQLRPGTPAYGQQQQRMQSYMQPSQQQQQTGEIPPEQILNRGAASRYMKPGDYFYDRSGNLVTPFNAQQDI